YGVLAAKSVRASWDETFNLMVDAFLRPALPPAEIELLRRQQLAALKHEQEDPDARLTLLAHQTIFRGHPYEHRAIGTAESVAKRTRAALAAHLAKLRERSRLLFVVVGDVDAARVLDACRAAFGALSRGDYRETTLPGVRFDRPALAVTEA